MRVKRRIFAVIGVTTMTALAVGVIGVSGASAQLPSHICHGGGSQTNPYQFIQPANPAQLEGHFGHTGPIWFPGAPPGWGDIIPPIPSLGFAGLNWPAGEAIWANECVPPELQPSPPAPSPPAPSPPAVTGGGPGPGPGPGKQEPPAEAAQPAAPAELAFTGPAETVIWLGLLAAVFAAVGLVLLRLDTKRQ
jgi:hypothetical protein